MKTARQYGGLFDEDASVKESTGTRSVLDADWEKTLFTCRHCHLASEGGRGPTGATGPLTAPLVIVGEGPGQVEDAYGVPLVGPSGQLLDRALASVGITRDRIYVTNIVKCRPRHNRTPQLAEGICCADRWLTAEIDAVRPKVIVALGKVALQYFLRAESGIVRARGKWIWWQGYPVMPTYHPAYLLRLRGNEEIAAKWHVYYDLLAAKEKAMEQVPDYVWQTDPMPDLRALYESRRRLRCVGE